MSNRVPILLALLAIGAAAAALAITDLKMKRVSLRVAALERKSAGPPQEPSPPQEKPVRKETDPEMIRGLAMSDCRQRLDDIARELKLEAGVEMRLRDAFADEFSFYAGGVVRAFEELQSKTSESNVMNSPEFQKQLEERILATDQKVNQILTVSQRWAFEAWRTGMRKEFYRLE